MRKRCERHGMAGRAQVAAHHRTTRGPTHSNCSSARSACRAYSHSGSDPRLRPPPRQRSSAFDRCPQFFRAATVAPGSIAQPPSLRAPS
eukprot:6297024-Prymnesium_polylepis.1